ncbi:MULTISPECIES: YsnF/AvaK domain-containing protein [unclassified Tolypothrix]|uniref:YsnF/AvaK domain-containing protein n=1 Tax=unclassified Tolypothrix TaxID=2649714 RepID=UPI0005EAB7C2|nr:MULTISPECIES: DUF2382 domain-containing protein [unclassified Tolypothrix]BAY94466.1 hypothetical protein NIES3275_65140 [Microchaete diplosiphon NIES-3275]EKF02820.1 putative PRC-barrel domain protein [Tolypothrix sp. PCC 7601]MBE9087058.1 DUF2382 domain-containing protein [Tolypothrix sp. LEGE 11397]UYD28176.1 DUF2382 domain-containing protein [Tolypothrix sp. PCC 7712]UYD35947.1 DUF2382 domain-containing protein [Tolypothrix sp. PCC 7601]
MNSQTLSRNSRQVSPAINQRISNLLDNLGSKVRNFTVIDRQGQLLGVVKDLVLDAQNRLNLVISKQINQNSIESGTQKVADMQKSFLLRSQRIKKIDNPTKSILIDLEKSEIENMSDNLGTNKPSDQIVSNGSTGEMASSQTINGIIDTAKSSEVSEERTIKLLEERLVINSEKRKVGDIIVRKEIETRMVQVPVRREKLIVEQVSPEHKQLAEIDLGQEEISGIELNTGKIPAVASLEDGLTVSGLFTSPKIASLLLNAIALEKQQGCKQVQVSIVVEDEEHRQKYQEWFDRCSLDQAPKPEL